MYSRRLLAARVAGLCRGFHLASNPTRLPRAPRAEAIPVFSGPGGEEEVEVVDVDDDKEQQGGRGRWRRFVRETANRRKVTEDGVESTEKQMTTSFGGIRLDTMNRPTLNGQEDRFETALESAGRNLRPGLGLNVSSFSGGGVVGGERGPSASRTGGPKASLPGEDFFQDGDVGCLEVVPSSEARPRRSSAPIPQPVRRAGGDGFSFLAGRPRGKRRVEEKSSTLKPDFDCYVERELARVKLESEKAQGVTVDNFVDEQYFSSSPSSALLGPPGGGQKLEVDGSDADDQRDGEELGEVDEQYFGGARHVDLQVKTDPEETEAMRELVREATEDLNFIDSQITFHENKVEELRSRDPEELKSRDPEELRSRDPEELSDAPPTFSAFRKMLNAPQSSLEDAPDQPKQVANPSVQHSPPSSALSYVKSLRQGVMVASQPGTSRTKEDFVREIDTSLQSRMSAAGTQLTVDDLRERDEAARRRVEDSERTANTRPKPLTRLEEKFKPTNLYKLTSMEVVDVLKKSILYHDNDILAVSKPYGLPMFDQSGREPHSLEKYLPQLAEIVGVPYLHQVHRLDKTTSGVLLLATTDEMRVKLIRLFKRRMIDKRYWAIVRGVPRPSQGIIDIPMSEGRLPDGRYRMTIQPVLGSSERGGKRRRPRSLRGKDLYPAVTEYRTLQSFLNVSLLEVRPVTGFRHQIRAHLGFGLGCPVIGDHKFTHIEEVGKPQKLSGETLHRFNIRQSKVRELPIYLHAKHIQIPEIVEGKQIWVDASLPHFFNKAMRKLKLHPDKLVKV